MSAVRHVVRRSVRARGRMTLMLDLEYDGKWMSGFNELLMIFAEIFATLYLSIFILFNN